MQSRLSNSFIKKHKATTIGQDIIQHTTSFVRSTTNQWRSVKIIQFRATVSQSLFHRGIDKIDLHFKQWLGNLLEEQRRKSFQFGFFLNTLLYLGWVEWNEYLNFRAIVFWQLVFVEKFPNFHISSEIWFREISCPYHTVLLLVLFLRITWANLTSNRMPSISSLA